MQKKLNRKARKGLIQARVNNEELQEIVTKTHLYAGGELSEFVRMACLAFKPIRRATR